MKKYAGALCALALTSEAAAETLTVVENAYSFEKVTYAFRTQGCRLAFTTVLQRAGGERMGVEGFFALESYGIDHPHITSKLTVIGVQNDTLVPHKVHYFGLEGNAFSSDRMMQVEGEEGYSRILFAKYVEALDLRDQIMSAIPAGLTVSFNINPDSYDWSFQLPAVTGSDNETALRDYRDCFDQLEQTIWIRIRELRSQEN